MNPKELLSKIMNNWPAKAISLALAIVIFIFHSLSTLEERFFSVPLIIEGRGDLIPANSYARMIRVTLRGDANTIYPVLDDDIEAYVDLGGYESPGNYRAEVRVRKKGTAVNVQPLEIRVEPADIELSLDHKISKVVPLIPSIRGGVASGYVLSSHSLEPAQVSIDGPSRVIENISELYTGFIDLDGKNSNFISEVNILNRDPLIVIHGSGLTVFKGFVSKIVPVRNISVPVVLKNLDPSFSGKLNIKTGSVHIEGTSQNELDLFDPPEDFLAVDCSGITEAGTYTLKVSAAAAPSIQNLSFEPVEVIVEVEGAE